MKRCNIILSSSMSLFGPSLCVPILSGSWYLKMQPYGVGRRSLRESE